MSKYAIFIDDCEIHIDLEIGNGLDSIDAIQEVIADEMQSGATEGYLEQYPFWLGSWEIVGYSLPVGFDKNTILEVSL